MGMLPADTSVGVGKGKAATKPTGLLSDDIIVVNYVVAIAVAIRSVRPLKPRGILASPKRVELGFVGALHRLGARSKRLQRLPRRLEFFSFSSTRRLERLGRQGLRSSFYLCSSLRIGSSARVGHLFPEVRSAGGEVYKEGPYPHPYLHQCPDLSLVAPALILAPHT